MSPVTGRWAKPVIVGERVTLRPIAAADATFAWEMVNDAEGNDLTATTPGSFTFEQIQEWCATRIDADQRLDLAIVESASGLWAGEVVLNEYDPSDDSANFRIALRGPAWFGRGLGSEATALVVHHGLATMRLHRITLTVLARNPRAQRAYEKAGFEAVERFHEDGDDWVRMAVCTSLDWTSSAER